MIGLLELGLGNVLAASGIAVLAAGAGRWLRRPALTHGLWLLFFLKLLTPPLFTIPVGWRLAEPPIPTPQAKTQVAAPQLALALALALEPPAEKDLANPWDPAAGWDALDIRIPPGTKPDNPDVESLPIAADKYRAGIAVLKKPPAAAPEEMATSAARIDWPWFLGIAWLLGASLWFGVAAARVISFHRLLRFAVPAPADLQEQAENLAQQLGVRCPQVWLVPGQLSPMLWVGGWVPRLLLPAGLLDRLDEEQKQALLSHELAHWRRGDHWVRRLELVVLGLYWWCPLVWWARHRLQQAEEECCDAWVVWLLPGAARGYALALVETVDFLCGARAVLPPAASGIGHVQSLRRRLTMIMRGTTPRMLTVGGVLAILAIGALLLPLLPIWAQAPAPGAGQDEKQQPPRLKKREGDFKGQQDGQFGQQGQNGQHGQEGRQEQGQGPPEKREHLEKARQEIRKMHEELEKMRAEMERKTKELHTAMQRLHQAEGGDPRGKGPPQRPGQGDAGRGRPGDFGPAGGPRPDLERRLEDVERKLDRLLDMMRKGPPQAAPGGFPNPPMPPGGDFQRRPGDNPQQPRPGGDNQRRPPGAQQPQPGQPNTPPRQSPQEKEEQP